MPLRDGFFSTATQTSCCNRIQRSNRVRLLVVSTHDFPDTVCDNKFPSIVASLFCWRCLAASTSSFLHAAINLRLPSLTVSSLSSPTQWQTPGCRSGRNRSTLSPSHPVLSILHPQGFRKRFASAAARRSFGRASPRTKVFSFATSCQCSHIRLSQGHGCTKSSDDLVSCGVPR